jgi:hypothetical protein
LTSFRTSTHDLSHDRLTSDGRRTGGKPMQRPKLPLLGSNQDSSDPESRASSGPAPASDAVREQSRAVESGRPTKSPTKSHPRPLALGGGNTGWAT